MWSEVRSSSLKGNTGLVVVDFFFPWYSLLLNNTLFSSQLFSVLWPHLLFPPQYCLFFLWVHFQQSRINLKPKCTPLSWEQLKLDDVEFREITLKDGYFTIVSHSFRVSNTNKKVCYITDIMGVSQCTDLCALITCCQQEELQSKRHLIFVFYLSTLIIWSFSIR